MKHVALTLCVVALFCAASYYVLTHPNLEQVERLTQEYEQLEAQNNQLAQQNSELERKIVALRDDPRLAKRRAREAVALAKPNEMIFQFEAPEESVAVRVHLRVDSDSAQLAGNTVKLSDLAQGLVTLRHELPAAQLVVQIDDTVSAIRRQKVIDIVDASPFASTEKYSAERIP